MNLLKQFAYKKFGLLKFSRTSEFISHQAEVNGFIKILFLRAGSSVQIDFQRYQLKQDGMFFIGPNQFYKLGNDLCAGYLVYYNRDFYCIEIHDKEVACDGILYNNVYEIPFISLKKDTGKAMMDIFLQVDEELKNEDSSMEEMLRILLKGMIIKSTRIWKSEHDVSTKDDVLDVEFLRQFSHLVEVNFRQYHAVSEYADILHITAKALNKRIRKYGEVSPNDMIKDRIILEAKRLLVHTDRNVKEIAYSLGYDDPAYFNRLFAKIVGHAPLDFRKQYIHTDKIVHS